MKQIGKETYEHKGIIANISNDAITDARDCSGIDIIKLIEDAINRMRRVTRGETENFTLKVLIANPICKSDKCQYVIDIDRK